MSLQKQIITLQINAPLDVKQGAELELFRRGQGAGILAASKLAAFADQEREELIAVARRAANWFLSAGVHARKDSFVQSEQVHAELVDILAKVCRNDRH